MRLLNIPVEGATRKRLTRLVEDFAAATIAIDHWGGDHVTAKYARIVDEVSFWVEKSERVITFWIPEMAMSDNFLSDQVRKSDAIPPVAPSRSLEGLRSGIYSIAMCTSPFFLDCV